MRTLELPKSVKFVDYSAFALHHSTGAVAITSQETSQLWVSELSGGSDGTFDPSSASFAEGKVFDFPRTSGGCDVQYVAPVQSPALHAYVLLTISRMRAMAGTATSRASTG